MVDYLRLHPRPNLFARELPLSVDTKFVERNLSILREWLDLVLPPHAIRADEEHFHRRYGLRYSEQQIFIRFLDESVQRRAGSPWSECSIPLRLLAKECLGATQALIVENKVNLLTLPRMEETFAVWGLGNGVTDLRNIQWLSDIPTPPDATPIALDITKAFAPLAQALQAVKPAKAAGPSVEPTELERQHSTYVKVNQALRQLNMGDDNSRMAGYGLYKFRIPVSVLPGRRTQRGHSAVVTLRAQLDIDANHLSNTFPRLIIADLVDNVTPIIESRWDTDFSSAEMSCQYSTDRTATQRIAPSAAGSSINPQKLSGVSERSPFTAGLSFTKSY